MRDREDRHRAGEALQRIANPADLLVQAAAMALELGNRVAVRAHYQNALLAKPYDEKIIGEAKRNLKPRGN